MHCIPCHAHCSFARAYRKAQPLAVAHRLLQSQDGEKFAQIGNPFKVTGGLADAVTLIAFFAGSSCFHAFVACFVQVVIMSLHKAFSSMWFISKVDDLKKVQSSELVVVQSNLMLCLGEH